MRTLVILPAFLTTFAGAVLIAVWALSAAIAPDMSGTTPGAALSGAALQDPSVIAVDEAQY